jgi:serine/threonine-protein kinase
MRAREIAAALFPQIMLLHLLGLAHNDIKPANILAERGKSWQLHDFGITTVWSAQAPSNYQNQLGTPLY